MTGEFKLNDKPNGYELFQEFEKDGTVFIVGLPWGVEKRVKKGNQLFPLLKGQ